MLQQRSIQSSQSLRDKILSFDYILILAILVLLVCAKILSDLILTPSDLFTTS